MLYSSLTLAVFSFFSSLVPHVARAVIITRLPLTISPLSPIAAPPSFGGNILHAA